MHKKPKVSVIMSVYNGENHIKQTIESILSQTFNDFEFIIIEDGSLDNTWDILTYYKNKDSRIKLIKNNRNLGLTKSLIKGVNFSGGDYIARIDVGDEMRKNRLEKQVNILDGNLSIGLTASNCQVKVIKGLEILGDYILETPRYNKKLKKELCYRNPISHSSVTFRKAIYQEVGGYNQDLSISQDYDLWIKLLNKSKGYIDEELLTSRIVNLDSSITVKKNRMQIRNGMRIVVSSCLQGRLSLFFSLLGVSKKLLMYMLPYKINERLRRRNIKVQGTI